LTKLHISTLQVNKEKEAWKRKRKRKGDALHQRQISIKRPEWRSTVSLRGAFLDRPFKNQSRTVDGNLYSRWDLKMPAKPSVLSVLFETIYYFSIINIQNG
jgi:hypothetical protein